MGVSDISIATQCLMYALYIWRGLLPIGINFNPGEHISK
jgi:hypothetical protein